MVWIFIFEDSGERVWWVDHPSCTFGPWDSEGEALTEFGSYYPGAGPQDVCYKLLEVAGNDVRATG